MLVLSTEANFREYSMIQKIKFSIGLIVSLLVVACGGGGSTTTSTTEVNTATYYSSTPISITGISDSSSCFFSLLTPIDMDGDGKKDLAAHFWCNQFNVAAGFNGPTPDSFKVFLNKSSVYEFGNQQIFGQSFVSLGGASRKVAFADINADGKPELAYVINREDGRPIGTNTSVAAAQSMILTSTSKGYTLAPVGSPDWFHAVDIFQSDAVTKSVVYQGFNNVGPQTLSLTGNSWTPATFTIPSLSGLTYRFLKSNQTLASDDLVITGGLTDAASLDIFIKSALLWTQGTGFHPVVTPNAVTMTAWNGDVSQFNRIDIGPTSYVAAGFDESCKLKISPNSQEVFIGRFSGRKLPQNYSGQPVSETALPLYSELMGFQNVNGQLQKIELNLDSPLSQDAFNFFECTDVNGDRYDDIVISHQRAGGLPDIYLNNKNGGFAKLTSSVFPKSPIVGNGRGMLADMDGDGVNDLIVFALNGPPHSIHVFKGTSALK
jgi:hypothetical protein